MKSLFKRKESANPEKTPLYEKLEDNPLTGWGQDSLGTTSWDSECSWGKSLRELGLGKPLTNELLGKEAAQTQFICSMEEPKTTTIEEAEEKVVADVSNKVRNEPRRGRKMLKNVGGSMRSTRKGLKNKSTFTFARTSYDELCHLPIKSHDFAVEEEHRSVKKKPKSTSTLGKKIGDRCRKSMKVRFWVMRMRRSVRPDLSILMDNGAFPTSFGSFPAADE